LHVLGHTGGGGSSITHPPSVSVSTLKGSPIIINAMARVRRTRRKRRAPLRATRRVRSNRRRGKGSRARRTLRRSLRRSIERKQCTYGAGLVLYGSDDTNWSSSGVLPLTPTNGSLVINQGIVNGTRIGNKITTNKVIVRLLFTPRSYSTSAPYSDFPRPMIIKAWICTLKTGVGNTKADCVSTWQAAAFNYGVNANLGLTGTLTDLVQPINTEALTIKAQKTWKIGRADYSSGTKADGTGAYSAQHAGWTNNDFKSYAKKTWDITKYIPSQITWEDGAATNATCTNKAVFLVIACIPADNTEIQNGYSFVSMQYRLDYHYTDL